MFGYVRAFKPYMRVFEYDIYKAVYCGLCKDMSRRCGFFTRFTLSYDLTLLALMDFSVRDIKLKAEKQRCIAHPLKKSMCACCSNDFSYSSFTAVILTYHKLKDDIYDKGISGKLGAMMLLPFFEKPYAQARKQMPQLASKVEKAMELQKKVENGKNCGIDRACEPTAKMMEAVFGGLGRNKEQKQLLERFGYLLGRYVYITDALDDLKEDYRKGTYNPLLKEFNIIKTKDNIPSGQLEKIYAFADDSINFTLGSLADVYVQLDLERYRDIIDNIIYLGLKNVYNSVRNGNFRRKEKYEK